MPNQYTKLQIEIPCFVCEKIIQRWNSKCKAERPVCSNECRAILATKWDDAAYKYVVENIVGKGNKGLAEHFDVSIEAMKRQISIWRERGMNVPYLRKKEVGDTVIRKMGKYEYLIVKTTEGWEKKELLKRPQATTEKKKPIVKPKIKVMAKIKRKPKAEQATQHGKMLAGKTLINQQREIAVTPFNPETHERVRDEVKKCWVERKKVS